MSTVYPNSIHCSPTYQSDALKYFVEALLDTSINSENWPYSELEQPGPPPYLEIRNFLFSPPDFPFTPLSFPCTRQQFYNYIDRWTTSSAELVEEYNWFGFVSGSSPLYTFPEPLTGWTNRMVNDWGKIKTLEFGLFGSVGNGGSLSNNSIVGSGSFDTVVSAITQSQLNYLRYGLTRFESYGTCHPIDASSPAPTNPVTNTSARTFDWTFAPGYTNLANYEYSINGGEWTTPTTKPINIPTFSHIPSGGLLLRTKGGGYVSPSSEIRNSSTYIGPFIVYIWIVREGSIDYTIRVQTEKVTASSAINFSGNLVLNRATGGASTVAYSINLPAGNSNAIQPREASFALASDGHFINTCTASPSSTTSGRPIQVFMNFVPIS